MTLHSPYTDPTLRCHHYERKQNAKLQDSGQGKQGLLFFRREQTLIP